MDQHNIPFHAIFGLERHDEDWGELRAMQLEQLDQTAEIRLGILSILSLLTGVALVGTVPTSVIVSWTILNCALALASALIRRKNAFPTRHRADTRQIWYSTIRSGIFGLSWSMAVPMIVLAGVSESTELYGLVVIESFTLVAMLMFATNLASLPAVSVMFNSIVTIFLSGAYFLLGQPYLAGSFIVFSIALSYVATRSGYARMTLGIAREKLREESETVSLLLKEFEDSGADWLWQTDTSRRLVHVSPRFAHAVGMDAQEISGMPVLKLVAGESWEDGNYPKELHEFANRLRRREAFSNLILPIRTDGSERWWELSASPRYSDDGEFLGFRGVGSDVTEQWESQKKISHLARFDTLTGLPNRLQVTEALSNALSEAQNDRTRCCFLMIDLDRFKQVNDTLGHQIGDRLLAKVAQRLNALMSKDALCGRLGGDEFAIVLRKASDSQYIDALANEAIKSLSKPYEIDQHTIYIGASIGSAIGPKDGKTVEMLMRSADLALYHSKEAGRGVHNRYEPELHAQAEERRLMEIELRKALANDEFTLVYQPVVNADDGMLISFEALLRWHNSTYGDVSPAKFIPLAEEANLIVQIGAWAVRHACKQAVEWPPHVHVAVNVSADQLMSRQFVNTVVGALKDSGLEARRLEIEVTESLFLRDGGVAADVLDQLQALGVKLSLDDFGTGYSSLGYLRKTRFDTIKIDKSFVQGAARNIAESTAIVRAVIAMADSLDMATTAEGVETEQELETIRKLGCKKIQGYLFGRPMAFEATLPMFAKPSEDFSESPLYRRISFGK